VGREKEFPSPLRGSENDGRFIGWLTRAATFRGHFVAKTNRWLRGSWSWMYRRTGSTWDSLTEGYGVALVIAYAADRWIRFDKGRCLRRCESKCRRTGLFFWNGAIA
jgi:hypothetical protein